MARARLRRILREKTSERVYPKTLIVASLTAATVALVTSQLTSFVDSLVLVTLASLFTAVIGEGYRLTLEAMQAGMARAAGRSLASSPEEEDEITQEVLSEFHEEEREGRSTGEDGRNRSLGWLFAHRLFVSRWAVPLVFALVALLTVSASYGVGRFTAAPDVELTRVTEVKTEVKDVSESTVRQLEAAAEKEAEESAAAAAAEASATAESELATTREELMARIVLLEASLSSVEGSDADEERALEAARNQLEELSRILLTLESDVQSLEDRILDLEAAQAESDEESEDVTPPEPEDSQAP